MPSILIVDDTKAHRHLIKRALKKTDVKHPVVEAASLQEAVELLNRGELSGTNTPLLAVVDLNLGDGRGTDFISALRASKEHTQLPIIVLSTSSLEEDISESYQVGANCYLTKASDVERFQQEISSGVKFWLSQR